MAWVWTHSTASGNDRLALLCLADEADDDGANCYPSTARIAAKCNIDKGTALDVIRRLEAAGEVIVKRPERYGRGRHNRYVLVLGRDVDELRRRVGWDDTAENGGEAPPLPPGDNPPDNGGDSPPLNDKNGGATPPKRWRDTPEKVVPAPPDPKTDPYRPPERAARQQHPRRPPASGEPVIPPTFERDPAPRLPSDELAAALALARAALHPRKAAS